MNRFALKLLVLLTLVVPMVAACGSGATGATETLKPFDMKAKAKREKKEDTAIQ